ncbi:hypothetical protein FB446DRAFT_751236 [Lentinula raphanica]|nr:hypothetical protein FB446DRAFT_751236 [Lentinula raphanica]
MRGLRLLLRVIYLLILLHILISSGYSTSLVLTYNHPSSEIHRPGIVITLKFQAAALLKCSQHLLLPTEAVLVREITIRQANRAMSVRGSMIPVKKTIFLKQQQLLLLVQVQFLLKQHKLRELLLIILHILTMEYSNQHYLNHKALRTLAQLMSGFLSHLLISRTPKLVSYLARYIRISQKSQKENG